MRFFIYNLLSINYYQVYIRCVFPPDILSKSIKSKNQMNVFQLRLDDICDRKLEKIILRPLGPLRPGHT